MKQSIYDITIIATEKRVYRVEVNDDDDPDHLTAAYSRALVAAHHGSKRYTLEGVCQFAVDDGSHNLIDRRDIPDDPDEGEE